MLAAPNGWLYDPSEARAHRHPDGTPVPSVTHVLRAAGKSSDFSAVARDVLERKRAIGQAAHAATHYADEGDLDVAAYMAQVPEVAPYLGAWLTFRAARGFEPILLETVVASRYGYIGRFDRFGRAGSHYVLLDIKTGDPKDSAAHLQLAAYEQAFRESYPIYAGTRFERWSVRLCADGDYRLSHYTSASDRPEFLTAVADVHRETERRGSPCWQTVAA